MVQMDQIIQMKPFETIKALSNGKMAFSSCTHSEQAQLSGPNGPIHSKATISFQMSDILALN